MPNLESHEVPTTFNQEDLDNHEHEVIQVPHLVKPKRHREWAPFTHPLCVDCLQAHVWIHLVRFPVLKYQDETCTCPCRHEVREP